MPGAREMIETLAARDLFLGVVSNKTNYLLKAEVEHLGWEPHFGSVIDKPAPDPVHLALEGSGLTAGGNVWFVGDTDVDLQTAVAAGCTPVLVRPEAPADGEFAGHEPALHVLGCAEFMEYLDR